MPFDVMRIEPPQWPQQRAGGRITKAIRSMVPDFPERLAKIPWRSFDTAYGPGDRIGQWLLELTSSHWDTAFHASHMLWCSLCHGHAYVSSAAAPALPFLMEVAESADERLLIELLDVFLGFAICSRPPGAAWPAGGAWVAELRDRLLNRREWFETLTHSANEEVAGFAEEIVKRLAPVGAVARPAE